ncbi:hypothetical protein MUCCIDRAFT_109727 [Mucor lusitanicus CBS 277.49]|uniref:Uncharacterized protein n=1 Tax=Mucor lusitanicus CBS 277.49 TaxID=747725 RepID=A0A162QL10_MUCCL|nr:hypothetical protein MUCCIDRAFT_109727 [Mucor lusitanicus CBS 277.49]
MLINQLNLIKTIATNLVPNHPKGQRHSNALSLKPTNAGASKLSSIFSLLAPLLTLQCTPFFTYTVLTEFTFPARGISSILIPIDYKADILQILQDNNVPQALDFNPLDYKHIADSRFRAMSIPQLTCIAAAVHTDRCIRTVRYVKKHNVAGVLKFFLSQSWIPAATAHDLSLELLPASC